MTASRRLPARPVPPLGPGAGSDVARRGADGAAAASTDPPPDGAPPDGAPSIAARRAAATGGTIALSAILFLAALHGGCYLVQYASDVPADGGGLDGAPPDASRPDGGLVDLGALCPALRADFVCLGDARVPSGTPSTLTLAFDACACCPSATCAVTVDDRARVVRVETGLCPDPCACDACVTPVVDCALPALARGTWTVEAQGHPAFLLTVEAAATGAPPSSACVMFASADSCAESAPLRGRPMRVAEACVEGRSTGLGEHEVVLVDDCGGCARDGTCVVTATERLTDDLPPGRDVRVEASLYDGACDGACPPACFERRRRCRIPAGVPGTTDRVFVPGLPPLLYDVGGGARACVGSAAP